MPLPPASFSLLVLSLRAQAEMHLGLMHYGEEDKPEPNLLEKTKGNLTVEEHRLLENSVTELRFRYVQVSEEVEKAAGQKA